MEKIASESLLKPTLSCTAKKKRNALHQIAIYASQEHHKARYLEQTQEKESKSMNKRLWSGD